MQNVLTMVFAAAVICLPISSSHGADALVQNYCLSTVLYSSSPALYKALSHTCDVLSGIDERLTTLEASVRLDMLLLKRDRSGLDQETAKMKIDYLESRIASYEQDIEKQRALLETLMMAVLSLQTQMQDTKQERKEFPGIDKRREGKMP